MKDYIEEIISSKKSRQSNLNLVREYLQKYILYILHKKKYLRELIFTGGTGLRFLYGLKRFSEDLDFSLDLKAKDYHLMKLLNSLKKELEISGYTIDVSYDDKKSVHSAFAKFPGLLYELKMSPHKSEKLSIKLEIDTHPPPGGITEVTLYNSIFMFHLLHFNIQSLFAGKIHALLSRRFLRGRDYYDLIWYLTKFKNIKPNFTMLNNAMKQTEENPEEITEDNWHSFLERKIEDTDMRAVVRDVEPLLEDQNEISLLKKEVILECIEKA